VGGDEALVRETSPPTFVVMPGSRQSEVRRLMPMFGSALAHLSQAQPLEIVLPTLPQLADKVRAEAQKWPARPRIVTDPGEKYAAMRRARAALVASGSATLELALSGVPMVVAYRVSRIEELVARLLLRVDTIALPNLILGRKAVPECLQGKCAAAHLATALRPLLEGGDEREAQLTALVEMASLMKVEGSPSGRAAQIVEAIASKPARSITAKAG